MTNKNPRRNKQGQYEHSWGWQGYDREGNEYQSCECCGGWLRDGERFDVNLLPFVTYETPDSDIEVARPQETLA